MYIYIYISIYIIIYSIYSIYKNIKRIYIYIYVHIILVNHSGCLYDTLLESTLFGKYSVKWVAEK